MRRETTHPAYWPPEVPGYVPFNNNIATRVDGDHAKHAEELHIPVEDFLTLPNALDGVPSTTYVAECHAAIVNKWTAETDASIEALKYLMKIIGVE